MNQTAQSQRRPLVLIVDDHEDSGEVCALFLDTWGFDTCVATDVGTAVALVLNRRPDAIVTDIAMPETDGWALIRAVKANEAIRDIPIVVLSGHVDEATRAQAVVEGCSAFIPKPCDAPRLVETLGSLIGERSKDAGI